MSIFEKFASGFARAAIAFFVVCIVITFTTSYGWLHPALWGFQLLAFVVLEGALYFLKGGRTETEIAITLAMWTSVGIWFSFEHAVVLASVILVLRLLPRGWPLLFGAFFLSGGIASLVTLADLNPWSEARVAPWKESLFMATCAINVVLVFSYALLGNKAIPYCVPRTKCT